MVSLNVWKYFTISFCFHISYDQGDLTFIFTEFLENFNSGGDKKCCQFKKILFFRKRDSWRMCNFVDVFYLINADVYNLTLWKFVLGQGKRKTLQYFLNVIYMKTRLSQGFLPDMELLNQPFPWQSRTKRKNYVKFSFSRFFAVPQKVLTFWGTTKNMKTKI